MQARREAQARQRAASRNWRSHQVKELKHMSTIPDNFSDLFQKKTFAQLATLMSDGSPQVTPVWCEFDGTHVVINSAKGRVKDRNMRRNPTVALSIQDPENPYRHLSLKGKVVEITESGADAHIDKLAKKYTGKDVYPNRRPGEVRVIYKILPEQIFTKI
jgi:PPOX class probable F420-dependent enzyme